MLTNIIQSEPAFNVIGITVRTTTEENLKGTGPIVHLWEKFLGEGVLATIPHKIDNNVLVLYYDYASDKDGAYTMLIGARVSSLAEVPAGMIAKHIPAEKRSVIVTEGGPGGVFKAWQAIWQAEDKKTLHRSYKVDYESYGDFTQKPTPACEIHLGV